MEHAKYRAFDTYCEWKQKKMDIAIYSLSEYENAYIFNKAEYCK